MSLTKPQLVAYRSRAFDYRSFCCGSSDLDEWLSRYAGQNEKRQETRTHLLVSGLPESREVLGYFALQNFQIAPQQASKVRNKESLYPMPATLLAKLAVAQDHQGKGYGGRLLNEAMKLAIRASRYSASAVFVVDAIDDNAKRFYERYGLESFKNDARRLFIPMKTITKSLESTHDS